MRRWRTEWICGAIIVLIWTVDLGLAPTLSEIAASRFGPKLLQAMQGNVADATAFLTQLLHESAILFTAALAAILIQRLLARCLGTKPNRTAAWVYHSAAAFILVNVWLALAMHTTLFWCLMWQGQDTNNLVRFRLKVAMLCAYPSAQKAVILGNSQARAQLDEELLNQLLDPPMHTAELHFPGARAYDLELLDREIESARPQTLICYVSELTFYAGSDSLIAPVFFSLEDIPHARFLQATAHLKPRSLGIGLLGQAVPIFGLRDVLAQRLLGRGLTQIRERQHTRKIQSDPLSSNRDVAAGYRLNHESDFQKAAFVAFAEACERRRQQLMILAGQLNPALSTHFDPRLRADLLSFLRQLRDRHANIVLLEQLPSQAEADYDDLTHVNKARQEEFTRYIAGELKSKVLARPGK